VQVLKLSIRGGRLEAWQRGQRNILVDAMAQNQSANGQRQEQWNECEQISDWKEFGRLVQVNSI
jgi:hypothetical protein